MTLLDQLDEVDVQEASRTEELRAEYARLCARADKPEPGDGSRLRELLGVLGKTRPEVERDIARARDLANRIREEAAEVLDKAAAAHELAAGESDRRKANAAAVKANEKARALDEAAEPFRRRITLAENAIERIAELADERPILFAAAFATLDPNTLEQLRAVRYEGSALSRVDGLAEQWRELVSGAHE